MTLDPRRAAAHVLLCALMLAGAVRPAFAFRFVNWNILNWPGTASTAAVREPAFRTVLADIQPDVLVVQEMQSQAGVDQFLNNVLNVINPGQWAAVRFHDGPDTDNAFFYKPSVVSIVDSTYIATDLRDIGLYRFRIAGYTTPAAEISAFSMHLKASNTLADQHQRRIEAVITRNYANGFSPGTNFVYCGDMNVYTNLDSGYVVFLENQADNDGRAHDPLNRQGSWMNNATFADIHTQSTRTGTLSPGDGGATGGLDDRFDQVLFSPTMDNGQGLDWIPGKYRPWGNDGKHFNLNINDTPVDSTITQTVANALQRTSDHLPVVLEFRAPALSAIAQSALDFDTVLVGAPAPSQSVDVSNVAAVPADGLDFTVSAPAGFSAAPGPYAAAAGAGPTPVTVSLDTSTPGVMLGNLLVSSDDPETPVRSVDLAGTVLAHAAPSLTSDPATFARLVDWGVQPEGGFAPLSFAVYNTAASPAARLELGTPQVLGGDGRFTLDALPADLFVGADSLVFTVAFHDSGATPDSEYQAEIAIPTGDDSTLAGATALDSLHVELRAQVGSSPVAVEDPLPKTSGLRFASANPSRGSLAFALELAHDAQVKVELFDVHGRLTQTLASGFRPAGRYDLRWSAKGAGRSFAAGVYFLRFDVDGARGVKRVVLLP